MHVQPGLEFCNHPYGISSQKEQKKKKKDKEGVCKPGQDTMAVRGERGIEEERTKSRDER